MYIKNKLKKLINNHIYQENEQFLKEKITVLNSILLLMLPSVFIFSLYRYYLGEYIQASLDLTLVGVIIISFLYLSKDKKNLKKVSRVSLIFSIIVALSVIIRLDYIDTRFAWVNLISYLIIYLLGAKEGKKWFIAFMILLSALVLLSIINISFFSLVLLVLVNSAVVLFLIQYENIKKKSEEYFLDNEQKLQLAVDEKILEIKEQKYILESLFQKSYDGILLIEDGKFVKCNDAIVSMLGYKNAEELLNIGPSQLSPKLQPDGRSSARKADEMMKICIESGSNNFEWVHQKANGDNFWCDITLTYLRLDNKNIIHVIWRDIEDKKALECENEQMYHNLESEVEKRTRELHIAMRAKGDFLANMSHEIRTPLNAILGFIGILKKDEEDEKRKKYFDILDTSSHSLLTIINDILDFSKIESGKLDIEKERFDIKKAYEEIFSLYFEKAKAKDISLHLNIDASFPKQVLGDVVRVKQIVSNILSNAIKFTPDNGSIEINVYYDKQKNYLKCSIVDNGIGIQEQNLSKVFNAFSQADSSTTRKFGGTGLGLSISKHLVELMNGSIEVSSVVGKGTSFRFEIELPEEDDAIEPVCIESEDEVTFSENYKVLVVEDNKTNQMLIKILLMDVNLGCDIVENGQEAIDRVKEKEYDIILMDENMPILNGIEASKKIREMEIRTPIIAVTANAFKGDKEKFLKAGMDDYISKPIDIKEFLRVLKKYLN